VSVSVDCRGTRFEGGWSLPEEKGIHIFVVDDEIRISETLALILSRSGFTVSSFTDPLKALDGVPLRLPDVLLTDVVMPNLSGIDLAIQIKEKCPACKILLFSGQAETLDLLGAARERGHDFSLLAKPVHPLELLRQIKALLE
jgi:DNA-binding response OmpR family regulator